MTLIGSHKELTAKPDSVGTFRTVCFHYFCYESFAELLEGDYTPKEVEEIEEFLSKYKPQVLDTVNKMHRLISQAADELSVTDEKLFKTACFSQYCYSDFTTLYEVDWTDEQVDSFLREHQVEVESTAAILTELVVTESNQLGD